MQGGPSPDHPTREAPLLGRRLADKYEITAIIGRGGLGTVYRGVQHPIGREVAVKVINPQRATDAALRQRFLREASAAAALKHANLVALYDYGEDAGELFMVMELLEGHELREALDQAERLTPAMTIDIARQICDGLGHAHERGLVHRDLKPENIMISRNAAGELRVRVLDFGIVKVIREDALAGEAGHETKAGVVIGTPAYMAPEQAYARGIDQTTDQYSLGVMVYEMLTGTLPYSKGSDFEVMTAHCIKPIPPMPPEAEVPPALEAVVRKAMSKDGGDRYVSIEAFGAALAVALTAPPPVDEAPNRRGWIWLAAGLLAVAAAVAFAWPDGAQSGRATVGASQSSQRDAHAAGHAGRSNSNTPSVLAQLPGGETARPTSATPRSVASTAPPSAAPPSAAPPSTAPPSPAPPSVASVVTTARPPVRPKKPRPPKVRVTRIQKDCAAEFAAIQRGARGGSLSKGSGLCRKLTALGKRVRANRCTKPVPGISRLLIMCEE